MARVITITGGKGGVGKTNISLNLALCLSKLGPKVCLFDADLGLANINILLGLYPEYNLEDVILNKKSLQEIIINTYQGVDIIPGSSGVEKIANLEQNNLNRLIQSFSELEQYDFFIFDTSSGISKSVISFCLAASEVVLIITPEPTSLTDAYALLKVLCFNEFDGSARVVVNQCKNTTVAKHTYNKFKEVVQKYLSVNIVPLGIVVQDNKFPEAVKRQQPLITLYPETSASKCFKVMASRLIANVPEDFKQVGITSFWTKFLEFTKGPLKLNSREEETVTAESTQENEHEQAIENEQEEISQEESITDLSQRDSVEGPEIPPSSEIPFGVGTKRISETRETKQPFMIQHGRTKESSHPLYDKIEFSRNLPTLPHILLKLIEACNSEKISIKDLGGIVEKDPSLCIKILRIVNSAYYNLPHQVNNFNQALSLLGIDTLRNIAMSASVSRVFNDIREGSFFSLKQFWWHSLMCAVVAELLAKKVSYPSPEEAFLSGLLHDIGKLVLIENFPEEYAAIVKASKNNTPLFIEEEKHLGISHADTGFWLINRWHLQSFIADAVLYHHEPLSRIANSLPLVKIIHVANVLSFENSGTKNVKLEMAEEVFGLESTDIETIIELAEDKVNQIARTLEIDIEAPRDIDGFLSDRDKEIQADLVSQVRDISLLQGTLQNLLNAHDIHSIVKVAQHGLQILFDIKDILFFLYDQSENVLVGASANNDAPNDLMHELTIPLQDGKSLLVVSLQKEQILDSFSYRSQFDLTIIDEQLIRFLGKEGIMCFPMTTHGHNVGIMVLGVEENQVSQINKRINNLRMFIDYAALALNTEIVRRAQARTVLTERLAASTAIAKKVAHEVNNPLSIIKNYLKILQLNLSEQNIVTDEVKIINEEIDRVSLIIGQLSDFSQPKIEKSEPVDLNALLKDIATLTSQPLLQDKINIHLDLDSTLPTMISGENSLKQIFINLIKNAAEALQSGGNITISTKHSVELGSAEIIIQDDGPGLPEVIKSRLFEPYISTKGEDHNGLGLSIAYNRIKELKGSITCKTEKEKGTTFIISLPLSLD